MSAVANGRGLGQVGKSLLADESALRFGAAYPGGIWPRGVGNADGSLDAGQREAERRRQVEMFAQSMDQLRRHGQAGRGGAPARWVVQAPWCLCEVDDLVRGLDAGWRVIFSSQTRRVRGFVWRLSARVVLRPRAPPRPASVPAGRGASRHAHRVSHLAETVRMQVDSCCASTVPARAARAGVTRHDIHPRAARTRAVPRPGPVRPGGIMYQVVFT